MKLSPHSTRLALTKRHLQFLVYQITPAQQPSAPGDHIARFPLPPPAMTTAAFLSGLRACSRRPRLRHSSATLLRFLLAAAAGAVAEAAPAPSVEHPVPACHYEQTLVAAEDMEGGKYLAFPITPHLSGTELRIRPPKSLRERRPVPHPGAQHVQGGRQPNSLRRSGQPWRHRTPTPRPAPSQPRDARRRQARHPGQRRKPARRQRLLRNPLPAKSERPHVSQRRHLQAAVRPDAGNHPLRVRLGRSQMTASSLLLINVPPL